MPESLLKSLFSSSSSTSITLWSFLLCMATALVLGAVVAAIYRIHNRCSQSFIIALALLPCIVCMVILMVNGNLGAGVAVAGAFSLIRFRSAAGSAKEIVAVFLTMAIGLATGMGYLGCAALFAVIIIIALLLYEKFSFGADRSRMCRKLMRITVPEDLDYGGIFDDLFEQYTIDHELVKVKTAGLGSLFRLTYTVTLRDPAQEKAFIDALRCRNGNLEITSSLEDLASDNL